MILNTGTVLSVVVHTTGSRGNQISRPAHYRVLGPYPIPDGSAQWYRASSDDPGVQQVILKVASTPEVNSLLENDYTATESLQSPATVRTLNLERSPFDPKMFLLHPAGWFEYPQPDGKHRCNIFTQNSGNWLTLKEVKNHFAIGIPPKQIAWMMRRATHTLAFAYGTKRMHGAVTPNNLLIDTTPKGHHINLINWDFSVFDPAHTGATIDNVPLDEFFFWYPQWVFDIEGPKPYMDSVMIVRCMVFALGGDPMTGKIPKQPGVEPNYVFDELGDYFSEVILSEDRELRAMTIFDQFSQLIESFWGPPNFVEFQMPMRRQN